MCIQNALQQHILEITNDGKDIVEFFYATMHGQNPNAKIHHQMDAAKQLRELGLTDSITVPPEPAAPPVRPEPVEGHNEDRENPAHPVGSPSVRPEPVEGHAQEHENTPSPLMGEGWDGGENPTHPDHPVNSPPVTDFDIINYEVARLIREETNDGYLIADFLARVMRGTSARLIGYIDKKEVISEANRMAAAKELMDRGLGRFGDSRARRLSDSQQDEELIQSGLARYIRERTEYGTEAARFMLDVASGEEEGFSMHQRVVATREIMRRGWDTNYDAITSDHIVAYYERQDAREPTKYDIALHEWREEERAAREKVRDRAREDEPQLESGLLAHLTEAEIARFEAMRDKELQEFIEEQRQRQSSRDSAASVIPVAPSAIPVPSSVIPAPSSVIPAPSSVIPAPSSAMPAPSSAMPAPSSVIPALSSVIPAKAGIQKPHTPDDFSASTHTENVPEPDESNQDAENTTRIVTLQDVIAPITTPHPTHHVRPKSLTQIRSP